MDKQGKDLISSVSSIVLFAIKYLWLCFFCLDYSNIFLFPLVLLIVINEKIYFLNINFCPKIHKFT